MLMTPTSSDAGPDLVCKQVASVMAQLAGSSSESLMDDLATYRSNRVKDVEQARQWGSSVK